MSYPPSQPDEWSKNAKRPFAATFEENDNGASESSVGGTPDSSLSNPISIEEASVLPPKIIRDELVLLYFRHIHPLLPFIDEYRFSELYYTADEDEEFWRVFPICLFQVMMYAAFTHISEDYIRKSPYDSLPSAQKTIHNRAKALYRAHSQEDHITLTKVALLLSYYSPCDSESEVNRFWVDQSLYHAHEERIWDADRDSGAMSSRNRLLWWCCLTRDRFCSLGLRRPLRQQEHESKIPMVKIEDFGLESLFPRFVNAEAKLAMITVFIWFCRLSDITTEVTMFLKSKSSDWRQGTGGFVMPVEELNQVRAFEDQLVGLKVAFKKECGQDAKLPGYCKMQRFTTEIINSAVIAALYRPYIKPPPQADPLIENFKFVALRRIKEASTDVASSVHGIMTQTNIEDIPVLLVAWLALPICFYEVKRSTESDVQNDIDLDHLTKMHDMLSLISNRFQGAKFVAQLMNDVSDLVSAKATELVKTPPLKRRVSSSSLAKAGKAVPLEDVEADIFDIATKFVDLRIAVNVPMKK